MEYVNLDLDRFVTKAKKSKKWVEESIIQYILREKDRQSRYNQGLMSGILRGYIKPLRLLLELCDIAVNWKRINKLLPATRSIARDRLPTEEELRLMFNDGNLRFKTVLLTKISSGIRVGARDYLNVGHVIPFDREKQVIAAKLRVYADTEDEYHTFISPEAYKAIQEYLNYRRKHGEIIDSNSPLIRNAFDVKDGGFYKPSENVKRLISIGVRRIFEKMFRKHFRKEIKKRHEFSIHTLRKYFETQALHTMNPFDVAILMGHSTGINDHYYKPSEYDLLTAYLNSLPHITITGEKPSEALKKEIASEIETKYSACVNQLETERAEDRRLISDLQKTVEALSLGLVKKEMEKTDRPR